MRPQFSWTLPSSGLDLTAAYLHVWQISLDRSEEHVAQYWAILAADERARADRFHFERDRRRYIVARSALRSIIGHYLDVSPERLAFDYGPQGKPRLSLSTAQLPLQFNLTHSHELALCAITRAYEVGIDLEYTKRQVTDIDQLAERFFSVNENAVYRALPASERRMAFFRCWTRKEAFIKAVGDGLSHPLDRFDVTIAADQLPSIISIEGELVTTAAWSLFHLEPSADYVGAVAVHGAIQHLAGWIYP
jgi:4'-phosphopantetheinyl transferase